MSEWVMNYIGGYGRFSVFHDKVNEGQFEIRNHCDGSLIEGGFTQYEVAAARAWELCKASKLQGMGF